MIDVNKDANIHPNAFLDSPNSIVNQIEFFEGDGKMEKLVSLFKLKISLNDAHWYSKFGAKNVAKNRTTFPKIRNYDNNPKVSEVHELNLSNDPCQINPDYSFLGCVRASERHKG